MAHMVSVEFHFMFCVEDSDVTYFQHNKCFCCFVFVAQNSKLSNISMKMCFSSKFPYKEYFKLDKYYGTYGFNGIPLH